VRAGRRGGREERGGDRENEERGSTAARDHARAPSGLGVSVVVRWAGQPLPGRRW
jgi:hypothetical protein